RLQLARAALLVVSMDDASINLVTRWRAGDQQAAGELFDRYLTQLIGLAQSRLSARLSRRVHPEDVVQSAYRSFFAGARAGRFALRRGAAVGRLRAPITLHKLHDKTKHPEAARRDVRKEERVGTAAGLCGVPANLAARDPSPVEALALVDELENVMSALD